MRILLLLTFLVLAISRPAYAQVAKPSPTPHSVQVAGDLALKATTADAKISGIEIITSSGQHYEVATLEQYKALLAGKAHLEFVPEPPPQAPTAQVRITLARYTGSTQAEADAAKLADLIELALAIGLDADIAQTDAKGDIVWQTNPDGSVKTDASGRQLVQVDPAKVELALIAWQRKLYNDLLRNRRKSLARVSAEKSEDARADADEQKRKPNSP